MKRLLITGGVCAVAFCAGALLSGCATTEGLGSTSSSIEGTSNAVSSVSQSTSPSDAKKSAFVGDRFEAIRLESAKGEGENVEALATLLGESDRKAFARWMKANYAPLFTGLNDPQELLGRIDERRNTSG